SQGYNNKVGVACYSSRDLTTWKFEAIVLPKEGFPEDFRDNGVCERPKVIYNARTKKYVMWSHLDARGYAVSKPGVAISDSPTGRFTFLENKSVRPVPTSTFRDMNLWVDDDGKAYVYYSGEDNWTMHISRLSDDYTAPEMPMVAENEGKTWSRNFVRRMREAPAPFKWRNKYYIVTSACTGWEPNPAGYAVADTPLGPWKEFDNPCVGEGAKTTFQSQSTYILPLGGDRFMYMGDRWKSKNLADSRYIWLPFTMKPDGTFNLEWTDSWRPPTK
ncbi:MAG: beta-galactosidase, partial [Proteobacteria bacterium]